MNWNRGGEHCCAYFYMLFLRLLHLLMFLTTAPVSACDTCGISEIATLQESRKRDIPWDLRNDSLLEVAHMWEPLSWPPWASEKEFPVQSSCYGVGVSCQNVWQRSSTQYTHTNRRQVMKRVGHPRTSIPVRAIQICFVWIHEWWPITSFGAEQGKKKNSATVLEW